MTSPASCVRCSSPLPAGSAERLCPACLTAGDTAPGRPSETPRSGDSHPGGVTGDSTATPFLFTPRPVPDTSTEPTYSTNLPPAPPGYVLIRELGGGGMGDVYLARELVTKRLVAMKFLKSRNHTALGRFRTEVQALARLDHPHIVRIIATDFYRADPFFTMDYAPGGTLEGRVKAGGPLDPAEAAGLMAAAARAIHYAHERGVLHRDLKPSNILLSGDDSGDSRPETGDGEIDHPADSSPPPVRFPPSLPTLKVSDFGLARLLDEEGLTGSTGVLGTPWYMAPEQVSRQYGDFSEATDVYGLGATLYYLLTGRTPITGTREEALIRVVRDLPVRVRLLRPEIPAGLEAVVMKCLEKKPARRHASAAQLAEDLEDCAAELPPRHTVPLTRWQRARRWARHHRGQLAAAAVAVLLAAGLVTAGAIFSRERKPLPSIERLVDEEAAYLGRVRTTLSNETPFTLVGATGTPAYYKWRVTTGEIKPPGGAIPPFGFLAPGFSLIELFPDPGIDRYRLSVDLMQLEAAGAVRLPPVPALHKVGLYYGYELATDAAGGRVHTFGAIDFSDFLPVNATRPEIYHRDYALHELPLQPLTNRPFMIGSVPRDRPAALPGPSRHIEVEITPGRIRALFLGKEYSKQDAANLQIRNDNLNRWVADTAPGALLTNWSSRRPFGVWVYGSWVAVQNFTITPLPQS